LPMWCETTALSRSQWSGADDGIVVAILYCFPGCGEVAHPVNRCMAMEQAIVPLRNAVLVIFMVCLSVNVLSLFRVHKPGAAEPDRNDGMQHGCRPQERPDPLATDAEVEEV
jgi:hypothetical protein